MSSKSVRVNIYGKEYSINADVDIETTKKIAKFVDQKMVELEKQSSIRDNIKIAVLSALNIAGDLHEYKEKCEEAQRKLDNIQNRLVSLTHKIEENIIS